MITVHDRKSRALQNAKGGHCLVRWNMVCSPKEYGGLGVKNLRLLNNTMMIKWKWLRLVGVDKPWEGLNFELLKLAEHLSAATITFSLGSGTHLRFWTGHWVNG